MGKNKLSAPYCAHCCHGTFMEELNAECSLSLVPLYMVDKDGYRPNIGFILCNRRNQVLWARRCGHDAWQFPQGGVKPRETLQQALYRELWEEVGLHAHDVEIIGRTRDWLRYEIPQRYLRSSRNRGFRGQKQIWFLLRLVGDEQQVKLNVGPKPEFDDWCWVEYWSPVEQIIEFKREVYRRALAELEPLLYGEADSESR